MAMDLFNRAFHGIYNPPIPAKNEWERRDQSDRLHDAHGLGRYWALAMHPNSIPFENLGVAWPLGTALTPTSEQPLFRGTVTGLPCLRARAWDCDPGRKSEVEAVVFEAQLMDTIASYNLLAGPWSPGYATPTLSRGTLGLGNWSILAHRLMESLSEQFYEVQGLTPLSGWNFDSPFDVEVVRGEEVERQALPTERMEFGARVTTGRHQAVTFEVTLRIAHTLGRVIIRTPQAEHRGLANDVSVPNPILGMIVDLAAS